MRPGMMGMSFEDTFEFVCSKSGNLLQKESVASVAVKSFASHTVPFQKQWLCLLQRLVAVPSIVGDDED